MFNHKIQFALGLGFFVLLLTASCSKTPELNEPRASAPEFNNYSGRASTLLHPGRTLAANCFQCHGTDGYAGELKIAGQSASGMVLKLNTFKTRDPKTDIMYFHAQAYTDTEINLIADYFSLQ